MTTTADIQAVTDVVTSVTNESDTLTMELGIDMLDALAELKRQVTTAASMIEMHMCSILESPRVINGKKYEVKSAGKWRPDHNLVNASVKRASVCDVNGETRTPYDAVEEAMAIMHALYVSPSTMPKTGALDRLGIGKDDVASYERTGNRLSVTELPNENV